MTQQAPQSSGQDGRSFFGHPRGLATLFFTEMWERFSYYGMRGILILFMVDAVQTGGLGLTDGKAAAIYGLYTAAAYLTALPGGWLADRLLGARNAVFIGGIIIALGQFTLAFGAQHPVGFFLGLLLVVSGTGLLKPNVSAIVGELYPEGGARRDAGFSVFYMGINVGATLGPILCGFLGEKIAWKYAFMAAGTGMILGLIQYRLGAGLGGLGAKPRLSPQERSGSLRTVAMVAGGILLITVALSLLQTTGVTALSLEQGARVAGLFIFGLVVLYFAGHLLFGSLEPLEKKRLVVIFFLFVGAAMFWSGFEQAGSSMNLFAERLTNRVIAGWEAPASWLQSVNAIFIVLFAPVFAWLWVALGSHNPSIPVKFGSGLMLLGAGFLVMAWAALQATPENPVSPMWLITVYFLHTCGELCLSPVGLSSITKLAPKRLVGQMMGIWFMGSSLGNLMAGVVAGQMETLPLFQLFGAVALSVIGAGLLFVLFKGPINRLSEGVT